MNNPTLRRMAAGYVVSATHWARIAAYYAAKSGDAETARSIAQATRLLSDSTRIVADDPVPALMVKRAQRNANAAALYCATEYTETNAPAADTGEQTATGSAIHRNKEETNAPAADTGEQGQLRWDFARVH